MQRGGAPGLSTSVAPRSGTSVQPRSRAAHAGKAERRSAVEVKQALGMSSVAMPLARAIAASSSRVPARIASGVSSSMNVAPRTPGTAKMRQRQAASRRSRQHEASQPPTRPPGSRPWRPTAGPSQRSSRP
jgi:hypothetical protein